MKKFTLEEAIDIWNNPDSTFCATYILFHGHRRGRKPEFFTSTSQVTSDMTVRYFLDIFTLEDFNSDEMKKAFIEMVESEINSMDTLVANLSDDIDKKILDEIILDTLAEEYVSSHLNVSTDSVYINLSDAIKKWGKLMFKEGYNFAKGKLYKI